MISSCASVPNYEMSHFTREPFMRKVPYSYASHKDTAGKLAVVLPDNPDTNQSYYAPITDYLFKHSFDVVLIHKPGEGNFKKRSLDAREERMEDIISLISSMDSLYGEELILIGVGEGAYLLPALSQRLHASQLIILNAGVLSPLGELEYMSISDSLSPANEVLLARYGLDQNSLSERIKLIKTDTFGPLQLAPSSNRNWLSYYESPMMGQLASLQTPVYWYNYSDYPLISVTGMELLERIVSSHNYISYRLLNEEARSEENIPRDLKQIFNTH